MGFDNGEIDSKIGTQRFKDKIVLVAFGTSIEIE